MISILLQGVCLFVQGLSDSNISQNVKTTICSCKTIFLNFNIVLDDTIRPVKSVPINTGLNIMFWGVFSRTLKYGDL